MYLFKKKNTPQTNTQKQTLLCRVFCFDCQIYFIHCLSDTFKKKSQCLKRVISALSGIFVAFIWYWLNTKFCSMAQR